MSIFIVAGLKWGGESTFSSYHFDLAYFSLAIFKSHPFSSEYFKNSSLILTMIFQNILDFIRAHAPSALRGLPITSATERLDFELKLEEFDV